MSDSWRRGIALTVEAQASLASRVVGHKALSEAILAADPYFVTDEWLQMVVDSGTIDLKWDSRLLPSSHGFMGFERSFLIGPLPDGKTSRLLGPDPVMTALFWSPHPEGTFIGFVLRDPSGQAKGLGLAGGVWEEGEMLSHRIRPPGDGEDEHAFRWILPGFAVLAAMLSQRITLTSDESVPRAARRRLGRGGNAHATSVQVIHLRLPQRDPSDSPAAPRDWSMRWIVRGHWREQWFPSEGVHKPVFVAPYVKGPDDKPLVVRPKYFVADR